jgi:hypothetical protein
MILKLYFQFQTLILYYQVSSEKYDIIAGFEFQTLILYYQVSSEKYDIKVGFSIPNCHIILSSKK